MCCWVLGKNELALESTNKALEIDPYFLLSHMVKYSYLKNGTSRDALKEVLKAYEFYPNQPGFLLILFELYWESNDKEKALNCLVELLDKHHDTFQKTHFAGIYFRLDLLLFWDA